MRSPYWPVVLRHGDLTLRPIRYGDRVQYEQVRARNRAWLTPWDATSPLPQPLPVTFRGMVREMSRQAAHSMSMPFVLTWDDELRGEQLIGQLSVSSMMWGSAMSASVGYWIDQAYAGRGLMPTAVALVVDHLFSVVGLHRVEVNIRPENAPSLAVVHKLGFRDEGLRKSFLHINGAWADHRTFALVAGDIPEGVLARYEKSRIGTSG